MLAKAVQRDMQAIGRNGLSSQSGRGAKLLRKTPNPRCLRGLRKQREKQPMRPIRVCINSGKTKLL